MREQKRGRVSIIMGVYNANHDKWIDEAINSIVMQTYPDWELIICDDASSDASLDKLKQWEMNDSRIYVISNIKNMGLAYSLNRCLKEASGEYIARMDIDDTCDSDRIAIQVKYLEEHQGCAFCSTFAKVFDDEGVWATRKRKKTPDVNDFLYSSPFIHAALLARREVYEQVEYSVYRKTKRAEDYDFFMRAYAKGFRGENIAEYLYNIREDAVSFSRRTYVERFWEMKVRWDGFRMLGLLPRGIPYIVKPLIVGLIPKRLLVKMHPTDQIIRT